MTLKCDVLVVGAGPAGSSAGFFSKHFDIENKYETILVEKLKKKKYDEYHDMCGEGASKKLFDDVYPIKPTHIVNEIRKVCEHWPGGIEIETPMHGYIIDRANFFGGIIRKYEELGGKYIENGMIDFSENDNKIKVKLADEKFIEAKYLIAADGANSFVRKKLGIEGRTKLLLQYVIDKEPEKNDTLIFEYGAKYRGDYKWTFPHGSNTKIGFPYYSDREKIEEKVITRQARLVGFGGITRNVHGNVLLVGDAACQNNAITKGGIRPGMVAGKMAAEAVINGNPEEYDKKWKKSDFSSSLFLEAFNKLKYMSNEELAKHMEPFRDEIGMLSTIKALLFYRQYADMYKAYELSNRVGW